MCLQFPNLAGRVGYKDPPKETQFQPGNAGGRGKQRGARDRISRAFLLAFADDFEANGADAIARMRDEDVASYVKVAVSLQPKEVEHRHILEGLDEGQLSTVIDELRDIVASRVAHAPAESVH